MDFLGVGVDLGYGRGGFAGLVRLWTDVVGRAYARMVRVPDVAAGEVTVAPEAVIVSTTEVVIDVVAMEIGVDVRTTVCKE